MRCSLLRPGETCRKGLVTRKATDACLQLWEKLSAPRMVFVALKNYVLESRSIPSVHQAPSKARLGKGLN